MDSIRINDLELKTQIGVPDKEREEEQRVLCTVKIFFDANPTAVSDDISEGIDYEKVVKDIQNLAKTERKTIERFAEDIASHILKNEKAKEISVRIDKFIIPETKSISIKIHRTH